MTRRTLAAALAAAATTTIAATPAQGAHLGTGYGLTEDGTSLVTFPLSTPQRTSEPFAIQGLGAGETVVGIDRRPNGRAIHAVTSLSRLLELSDGGRVVRSVTLSVPLEGSRFGVDFNPTVDRLRIVSDTDQNLRVNPGTGATTVDGRLGFVDGTAADPTITGAAYTKNDNDFIATPAVPNQGTGTALLDLDAALGALVLQSPPNAGGLDVVGPLGQDRLQQVGFDVLSPTSGGKAVGDTAYAAYGRGGTEKLYTVDLTTGDATLVGPFGEQGIADIAVPVDSR